MVGESVRLVIEPSNHHGNEPYDPIKDQKRNYVGLAWYREQQRPQKA